MTKHISIFLISILIISCSTTNNVVSDKLVHKRKYNKGYHINNFKLNIDISNNIQQQNLLANTDNEENTHLTPKYKSLVASIFKQKSSTKKIELRSGTTLDLSTVTLLSSENKGLHIGKEVELRVTRDVKKDGHILIDRDARAYGSVTTFHKKKGGGNPGEIGIKVDRVNAVDNQTIYLSGEQLYVEGEDAKTSFWLVTALYFVLLLWPLLWVPYVLIKGKEAVIYPNTNVSARTNSSVDIEID